MLLGVEDEYIVYDALLTVALSAAKDYQVLTKLGAAVAVARARWLARGLRGVNLD